MKKKKEEKRKRKEKNGKKEKKRKKKKINERIIRDVWTTFEQEDDYYKPIRVGNIWNNSYR